MKNIYLVSGLGADKRVFQKMDLDAYNTVFIDWISPETSESIEAYAKRLTAQITQPKPVIIGLSFGGIMAVEIAKIIDTEKVILIASAKVYSEIPFFFRLAGFFKLHILLPLSLLKSPNAITNWFFGAHSTFEKALLKQILIDTDPIFLKWAIDKIVSWKNHTNPDNTIHIHGTADKIFPLAFAKPDIQINNGGHFMTLDKYQEIDESIKSVIYG